MHAAKNAKNGIKNFFVYLYITFLVMGFYAPNVEGSLLIQNNLVAKEVNTGSFGKVTLVKDLHHLSVNENLLLSNEDISVYPNSVIAGESIKISIHSGTNGVNQFIDIYDDKGKVQNQFIRLVQCTENTCTGDQEAVFQVPSNWSGNYSLSIFDIETQQYLQINFEVEAAQAVKKEVTPTSLQNQTPETNEFLHAQGELLIKFTEDPNPQKPGFFRRVILRDDSVQTKFNSINELNKEFDVKEFEEIGSRFEQSPDFKKKFPEVLEIKKFVIENESLLEEAKAAFDKDPHVEFAEYNYLRISSLTPNDTFYANQWALPKINVSATWNTETGDPKIIIAVIDTGFDYTHEDKPFNLLPGYDFVDFNTTSCLIDPGCDILPYEDYTTPDIDPRDVHGHGTHVAGIIAAAANNAKGIAGVCFNCSLMPLKAGFAINLSFDGGASWGVYGVFSDDDVIDAIIYAANNNASIISMSFGGPDNSSALELAINQAYNQGVVLVAAAGNDGVNDTFYPAAYDNVLAVASTDINDQRSYFSNYGSWVDLSAPGENILSTYLNSTYVYLSGTSMAAPIVAGVAGLLLSENSSLSNVDVYTLMKANADPIDLINPLYQGMLGSGRVKAFNLGITDLSIAPLVTKRFGDCATCDVLNATMDAGISYLQPTTSFQGNATSISLREMVARSTSMLMYFNTSSIPQGAKVYSAKLVLFTTVSYAEADRGLTKIIYRLNDAQGTGIFNETSATYNNKKAGVSWNTGNVTTAFTTLNSSMYFKTWTNKFSNYYLNANMTDMVQYWVNNPANNIGFMLSYNASGLNLGINSREAIDTNLRPYLEITYAGTQDEVIPQATNISVHYYRGQTFITWDDANTSKNDTGYYIYRYNQPINSTNILNATQLGFVRQGSSYLSASLFGGDGPANIFQPNMSKANVTLNNNSGMYVYTVRNNQSSYYAVATVVEGNENIQVTSGANTISSPVNENISMIDAFYYTSYAPYTGYVMWLSNFNPENTSDLYGLDSRDSNPFFFSVVEPSNFNSSRNYSLSFHLHPATHWMFDSSEGYDNALFVDSNRYGGYVVDFNSYDRLTYKDDGGNLKDLGTYLETDAFGYSYYSGWNTNYEPVISKYNLLRTNNIIKPLNEGVNVPYTEKSMIFVLHWMEKYSNFSKNIDKTQVFSVGGSLGAGGSLYTAMHYPNDFAAIDAVNHRTIGQYSGYDGAVTDNYYGNELENINSSAGVGIYEYLNMSYWVLNHPNVTYPYFRLSNGRQDTVTDWVINNPPQFFMALNLMKVPVVSYWDNSTHNNFNGSQFAGYVNNRNFVRNIGNNTFDVFDFHTNESYPAFTNFSLNGNPGNGSRTDGDIVSSINGYIWYNRTNQIDNASMYQVDLYLLNNPPSNTSTVSVTPIRLQHFPQTPFGNYSWTLKQGVSTIQSGSVVADQYGVMTINNLIITNNTRTLLIIQNLSDVAPVAQAWFVRPLGGTYGTENGSSYSNALDGLGLINWSLIKPGDSLYVCGTHIYGAHFTTLGLIVGASGNNSSLITIRGDCPGDQGVIIGVRKVSGGLFTNNGDGTFNTTFVYTAAIGIQGDPSTANGKLMWVVNSKAEVAAKDGSLWRDTSTNTLWVNPYGSTMEDIYTNYAGTALDLNGNDYITIRNLKLYAGGGNDGVLRLAKNDSTGANNINILNSEIGYGTYTGIYSGFSNSSSNNILIENTTIHRSKSGTYTLASGGYQYSNWTFRNVEVYSGEDVNDIFGGGTGAGKSDRHAIGGQNINNLLVEDSYVHDWAGDAILDYMLSAPYNMNNVTIRNNRVVNIGDTVIGGNGNYHYGIARNGDADADFGNRAENWSINNNIFVSLSGNKSSGLGVGAAFRTKGGSASDSNVPKFYNNVVYDANYGVYGLNVNGSGSDGVDVKNNIFLSPKSGGYHIFIDTMTGTPVNVTSNYNLFYPDGANLFSYDGVDQANLAAWRSSSSQDANSLIGNPFFINASGLNFRLQPGSPAIDRGILVGLARDFAGIAVPQGLAPDIGAYEFVGGPLQSNASIAMNISNARLITNQSTAFFDASRMHTLKSSAVYAPLNSFGYSYFQDFSSHHAMKLQEVGNNLRASSCLLPAECGNSFVALLQTNSQAADPLLRNTHKIFIVDIWGMPGWLSTSTNTTDIGDGILELNAHSPSNYSRWRQVVTEMGSFYNQYSQNVTFYFEIWNEPDLDLYWRESTDSYLTFYNETVRALKAVNPNFKVGGPAVNQYNGKIDPARDTAVNELINYTKAKSVPFDFISWHHYRYAVDVTTAKNAFYQTLQQRNYSTYPELVITEWNAPSTAVRTSPYAAGVMADNFVAFFKENISAQTVYTWQDYAYANDANYRGYGLISREGISLPVFYIHQAFDALTKNVSGISVIELANQTLVLAQQSNRSCYKGLYWIEDANISSIFNVSLRFANADRVIANQSVGIKGAVVAKNITQNGSTISFQADGFEVVALSFCLDGVRPLYSSLNGATTNFGAVPNISSVANAVLEKTPFGKIAFGAQALNFNNLDLDQNVYFGNNRIGLDSLNLPMLNVPATVTLYGLNFTNPIILENGSACSHCVKLNYAGGNLTFTVQHFSNFSAAESALLPTVNILSPLNDSIVSFNDLVINFSTLNWTVGGKGSTHIHFHIEGVPGLLFSDHLMLYNAPDNVVEWNTNPGPTPFATWMNASALAIHNVPNGQHRLRAHLADQFHAPPGNSEADKTIFITVNVVPGNLSAAVVGPLVRNVTKNSLFNMSFNITCSGGNCGVVNVTLDPQEAEKTEGFSFLDFMKNLFASSETQTSAQQIRVAADIPNMTGDPTILSLSPTELMGYYSFSGEMPSDESGKNNSGSFVGAIDCDYFYGVKGKGCSFSNVPGYIDVSNVDDDVNPLQGAISVWVFPLKNKTNALIVDGTAQNNNLYSIQFNNGAFLFYRGNTQDLALSASNMGLKKWHHLVLVWSTSGGRQVMSVYIDKALIGSTNFSGSENFSASSSGFSIGGSSSGKEFPGYIDEVRFYSGALNIEEVSQLYNEKGVFPFKTFFRDDVVWTGSNINITNYGPGVNFNESKVNYLLNRSSEGADVYAVWMMGWVPLFKSTLVCRNYSMSFEESVNLDPSCVANVQADPFYTLRQHDLWWQNMTGTIGTGASSTYASYILNGSKDMINFYIVNARKNNMSPSISFAVNDEHQLYFVNQDPRTWPRYAGVSVSKFFYDNPQYMHNPPHSSTWLGGQVWATNSGMNRPVLDYKLHQIWDLTRFYDFDLLELDFMRSSYLWDGDVSKQVKNDTTSYFIQQSRRFLDENTAPGKKRYLGIRINVYNEVNDYIGIPLEDLEKLGVDYVILASVSFETQDSDIEKIRTKIPEDIPILFETAQVSSVVGKVGNTFIMKKSNVEQIYTTAAIDYAKGAAGVYALNWEYYWAYGQNQSEAGPWSDPPFPALDNMKDKSFVSNFSNKYYFIGAYPRPNDFVSRSTPLSAFAYYDVNMSTFSYPAIPGYSVQNRDFKIVVTKTQSNNSDFIIRLLSENSLDGTNWEAKINGVTVGEFANVSSPYYSESNPDPYNPLIVFGGSQELNVTNCYKNSNCYKAWIVPKELLNINNEFDYINLSLVRLSGTDNSKKIIRHIDLYLESACPVDCGALPSYSTFNGATTNFANAGNLNSLSNGVLEKTGKGKIMFGLQSLNFSGSNLDSHVFIENNKIGINTGQLPRLNVSATVTLYNLSFASPRILENNNPCSHCNIISYAGGNLTFSVQHFSNFTAAESINISSRGDITTQLIFLGNPQYSRYPTNPLPRNVWDLQSYQGKVYIGAGDYGSNAGPIDLYYVAAGNGSLINETQIPDEQIQKFVVINGTLFLPEIDPRTGNNAYYRFENKTWISRSASSTIHTFDITGFNGSLFSVHGTNTNVAPINMKRSTDNGITWNPININGGGTTYNGTFHRLYSLWTMNNSLFAAGAIFLNISNVAVNHYKLKYLESNNSLSALTPAETDSLFPGYPSVVSGYYYGSTMPSRQVLINNITYYIATDQNWVVLGKSIFKATAFGNVQNITLPQSATPYDLLDINNSLFILSNFNTSTSNYVNLVSYLNSSGGVQEVLRFNASTFARSFEYLNGDFYFGLGTLWPTNPSPSNDSGKILKYHYQDVPLVCGNWIVEGTEECDDANSISGDGCESCISELPNYSRFNGNTTNFAGLTNITAVKNAILENISVGKISFGNQSINFTNLDLDNHVIMKPNLIGINTISLPRLNVSANLSFYNLIFGNPRVLENGQPCNHCNILNYSNGMLVFSVQHFSNFSAAESPVCGNNITEPGEECDDGNTLSGDGCSSTCMLESANLTKSIDVYGDFISGGVILGLNAINGNETGRIFIKRQNESVFREAQPFVRYDANHLATSLFDLSENTTYDLKLMISDQQNRTDIQFTAITTKPAWQLQSPTRIVNVNNDAELQAALTTIQPGDHIVLAPGKYTSQINIVGKPGQLDKRIVIRSRDLSDRAFLTGGIYLGSSPYYTFYGLELNGKHLKTPDQYRGRGISVRGSNYVEIVNNVLMDTFGDSVYGYSGSMYINHNMETPLADKSGSNLIMGNIIGNTDQYRTYYGIKFDDGVGGFNVIRDNIIYGHYDGISPGGDEGKLPILSITDPDALAAWPNQNIDIYHNLIFDNKDDCIETDGHTVNGRIFENYLGSCVNGISTAVLYPGPYFIVRNMIYGFSENPLKLNTGTCGETRNIYVYQNTMKQSNATVWTGADLFLGEPVTIRNVVLRNNILDAIKRPISAEVGYSYHNCKEANCATPCVCYYSNLDFDNDLLWSSQLPNDNSTIILRWAYTANANSVSGAQRMEFKSFNAFQQGTNNSSLIDPCMYSIGQRNVSLMQEKNGIFADPNLSFSALPGVQAGNFIGNLIPPAGSSAVDSAASLPGINDNFVGSAPDIGAFEVGRASVPSTPTNLAKGTAYSSRISLVWNASIDTTRVVGYVVYRNNQSVGFSTIPYYTDRGLNASSSFTYRVTAINNLGTESAPSNQISAATLPNTLPILAPLQNVTLYESSSVSFVLNASDVDLEDNLIYSASGLPVGSLFDNLSHSFTWTPDYNQSGIYTFRFMVDDGNGGTDAKNVTITVQDIDLSRLVMIQLRCGVPIPELGISNFTGCKDTEFEMAPPNSGYYERGSAPLIEYRYRSGLYWFNLSVIPSNVTVVYAKLHLFSNSSAFDIADQVPIYLVQTLPPNQNVIWKEGTGVSYYAQYGGTSWLAKDNQSGISPRYAWSSLPGRNAVGDVSSAYRNPALGFMNFTSSSGEQLSSDVYLLIQELVSNRSSYEGLMVDRFQTNVRKDEIATQENQNISFRPLLEIRYLVPATITCGNLNCESGENATACSVDCGALPSYSTFNGATTNFANAGNLNSLSNGVLEKTGKGKIMFGIQSLNFSGLNLDSHVFIENNKIGINSLQLPNLNVSATLTLYNVSFINPRILENNNPCSHCNIISYSAGNLIFSVQHFSNFSAAEQPGKGIVPLNNGTPFYISTAYPTTTNPVSCNLSVGGSCVVTFTVNATGNGTWDVFALVDSASSGNIQTQNVSVTIQPFNQSINNPPVLNPIGNKVVNENQSLNFTLSFNDPDGNNVSCAASNLPAGASLNGSSCVFSWTPSFSQAGMYNNVVFSIVDNGVPPLNDSESINITVNNVNRAPVLNPIGNKSVNENQSLVFNLSFSDPDNDSVTCSANNVPMGAVFNTTSCVFSWTPLFNQSGNYSNVRFVASDNGIPQLNASENITIAVTNVNRAPILNTIGNKSVNENQTLAFNLSFSDPDNDTVSCSASNLPQGSAFFTSNCSFVWIPLFNQSGNYLNVRFMVADNRVPPLTDTEDINITVVNVNRAPILNAIGNKSVAENQSLVFAVSFNDSDGDLVSCSAGNLPMGASFNVSSCVFSWVPLFNQSGTYSNVRFTVSDNGVPQLNASENISITVNNVNRAPVLNAVGNKQVNVSQLLSFSLIFSDADNDSVTCSASNLPLGASFNVSSCSFAWVPLSNQSGSYPNVLFGVSDSGVPQLNVSENITITVGTGNRPPVLNAIGNQSVNENSTLSFLLVVGDPDNDSVVCSASNLPAGSSFNSTLCRFTWTPNFTQSGVYQNIMFTIVDTGSPALSDAENISISVNNVNRAPVLNLIGDKSVNQNQSLNFNLSISDPDGDNVSCSASNLPFGAAFNASSCTFSWIPSFNQSGNFSNILFSVIDNGVPQLSDSENITIMIDNVNRAPVLSPIGNQTVNENATLSLVLSKFDPDGNNVTCSALNVPSGALFNTVTCTFIWTPTFIQSGVYTNIVFIITDNGIPPLSDNESINITVLNVNRLPVVQPITHNAVDISPLPGLQIYENSSVQYSGSATDLDNDSLTWSWIYTVNGGPEYTYSSGSGNIQPITFSYPFGSAPLTYNWVIRVSDGSTTAQQNLTVNILQLPQCNITAPAPAIALLENESVLLSWPSVGADYYLVYSANNYNQTFVNAQNVSLFSRLANTSQTQYLDSYAGERYYRVVAVQIGLCDKLSIDTLGRKPIVLYQGWNWISIFLDSSNNNVKPFNNSILKSLHNGAVNYSAAFNGSYSFIKGPVTNDLTDASSFNPMIATPSSINFTLRPDAGYHIYMRQQDTLIQVGRVIVPQNISLRAGWNWLSIPREPGQRGLKPIETSVLRSLNNGASAYGGNFTGSFDFIKGPDTDELTSPATFNPKIASPPSVNYELRPYAGYHIHMTEPDTLEIS